jgi:pilus assembly protein CpaF
MPILNSGAAESGNTPESFTGARPALERRGRQRELFQLKSKFHQEIIDRIDVSLLVKFENDVAKKEVGKLVSQLVDEATLPLNVVEKQQIIREVVDEVFGLGPLEPLLADASIDEILVNNYKSVYVERRGLLEPADIHFKDNTHLRHIINRIVSRVGRRIDESSPMVDARLPDGSRVNAIIPPLALDGPALSIRRFKAIPFTVQQFIQMGAMSTEVDQLLSLALASRSNLIVSGGTGSGKTTLLNVLSSYISAAERIITIEDAAEIQLKQPHVVRLETRPNNMEGKGGVTQRELFRNCLRMRPDRIIVGEVRGAEALDMLQAMNTGHDGSLTTIHANSPRDAIARIETMVLMSTANIEQRAVTRQIASAVHVIVQVKRYSDGVRRVESVQEITGMENGTITMQELISFEPKGVSKDGKLVGAFKMHPYKPRLLERAKAMGIDTAKYGFKSTD